MKCDDELLKVVKFFAEYSSYNEEAQDEMNEERNVILKEAYEYLAGCGLHSSEDMSFIYRHL